MKGTTGELIVILALAVVAMAALVAWHSSILDDCRADCAKAFPANTAEQCNFACHHRVTP